MKKYSLFIIVGVLIFVVAIGVAFMLGSRSKSLLTPFTQSRSNVVSQQEFKLSHNVSKQIISKVITSDDYKEWALNQQVIDANKLDWAAQTVPDCVKLINEFSDGGDVLSTLIVDENARKLIKLSAYSPDNVMQLENKMVAYTHRNYDKDFYASSVCHLSNDVDVATGMLWPRGDKPFSDADFLGNYKKTGAQPRSEIGVSTLIVVSGSSVKDYQDIQTESAGSTGAESYACDGTVFGDSLKWLCFAGLHMNSDETASDGANMIEWTIALDGSKVTKRNFVQ